MSVFNDVKTYLQGKKTYITVGVGVLVGVAQFYGYHIDVSVDVVLGFLGLGFHRASVSTQSEKVLEDVQALLDTIKNSKT